MAEIAYINPFEAGDFFSGTSCVFGVFDGFHRGHQFMVHQAQATATPGAPVVAITFDIDPDEVFAPTRIKKLMSNDMRIATLASSGVDKVAVLKFTQAFAAQLPEEFLENLFGGGVPATIHIGVDFGFGKYGKGNVSDMAAWGEPRGMHVIGHELFEAEGAPVTATRIRQLLSEGKVEPAAALLGRPYSAEGTVVHGRGSGTEFGIPTANVQLPDNQVCVAEGVYGATVEVDGVTYNAAVCIGIPPTFADAAKQQVEVHIIDFDGNLYGRRLQINFIQYIRPNRVFSGVDELVATLKDNIATIRATQPL